MSRDPVPSIVTLFRPALVVNTKNRHLCDTAEVPASSCGTENGCLLIDGVDD
jgi:hypothetical protein